MNPYDTYCDVETNEQFKYQRELWLFVSKKYIKIESEKFQIGLPEQNYNQGNFEYCSFI